MLTLQGKDGRPFVFFPGYSWEEEVNGEKQKYELAGQWFERMVLPELDERIETGEPLSDNELAQFIAKGIESGQVSPKDLADGRLMASLWARGGRYEGKLFNGIEKYLQVEVDGFGAEQLFLRLADGQMVEIEAESLAVNVDNKGNAFDFNPPYNILAVDGAGEQEGMRFAFFPGHEFVTVDEQGEETKHVIPAHWLEVIRFPYLEAEKNSKLTDKQLMEEAIKPENQVSVTLEQIFRGDWSTSVLLSGKVHSLPRSLRRRGMCIIISKAQASMGWLNFFVSTNCLCRFWA